MKPSTPVRSSSPASILEKISSSAPEAAICAATSAPLLGRSSATRSIVVLSDGPIPYTEDLTRPSPPGLIAVMLRREHPHMIMDRVSHETIYRALYVQTRGSLRKDLAAQLLTKRRA